ncbi:unnamed protein product [Boreogadus saida]
MRSLVFLLLIGVASLTPEAMGSGVMLVTLRQPGTLNHVWTCPSLSDLDGKNSCPGMSTNTVLCPGFLEGGGPDSIKTNYTTEVYRYYLLGACRPRGVTDEPQRTVSWGCGCAEKDHPGVHAGVNAVTRQDC